MRKQIPCQHPPALLATVSKQKSAPGGEKVILRECYEQFGCWCSQSARCKKRPRLTVEKSYPCIAMTAKSYPSIAPPQRPSTTQILLPHLQSTAPECNEKEGKRNAGQTSVDTHPARAPEGKTSRKSGYRSSPLSIQPQP